MNIKDKKILFLDLETQLSAYEVGGWQNAHLMRISVGVAYDSAEDKFIEYYEDQIPELVLKLCCVDMVVGFNIKRFDYHVLRGYSKMDFSKIHTFDILEDVHRRAGFRLSLDHLARATLNSQKSADGLQALRWFKEGKLDKIAHYCTKDVEITRDLFLFGVEKKHLVYQRKNGEITKLNVDWNLEDLLLKNAVKI